MHRRYVFFFLLLILSIPNLPAQIIQKPISRISIDPVLVKTGDSFTVRVVFDFPEGIHVDLDREYFTLKITLPDGFKVGAIEYPPGTDVNGITRYFGQTVLSATVRVGKSVRSSLYSIPVKAVYQPCDNSACYPPVEEPLHGSITVMAIRGEGNPFEVLRFLLLALLGGLILNIMPCVLPVLSIKALSLVNQHGTSRRDLFLNSFFYSSGILATLSALGLVVVIIKVSGESIGWGFQFQNPRFIVFLLTLLFVFALSLFDVFVFSIPGISIGGRKKSGFAASFFTGIMTVLLATPCSAPILGTALGFAFAEPPVITFLVIFTIGIGLSLPFFLIGIWPGFIKIIPKPGAWMNTFRQLMGFLLIGTSLWLVDVLFYQIGWKNLFKVLLFLGFVTFGFWLYGKGQSPLHSRIVRILSVLTLAAVITFAGILFLRFAPAPVASDEESLRLPSPDWEPFDPDIVDLYRFQGQPVFIDFSAKWCMTCKINESTVLNTARTDELFEKYGVKRIYADFTNEDPVTGEWIARFGKAGVPVYVLFPPFANEVILPEILTYGILEGTFDEYLEYSEPVEGPSPSTFKPLTIP